MYATLTALLVGLIAQFQKNDTVIMKKGSTKKKEVMRRMLTIDQIQNQIFLNLVFYVFFYANRDQIQNQFFLNWFFLAP